jgi:PAS domain S-box-containing protein
MVESAERKRAERALADSEEKYRFLFHNMGEGFGLYELIDDEEGRPVDWRVLEVNDAYTRHTGIPRDRIVGRRVSELYAAAIPEYLPIFEQVVATQTPHSFETFARAVGRHQRVFTFPAGGRRFASTIEDITERKSTEAELRRSEERFRSLFSNMTEGFALHEIITNESGDPVDYLFLDINPAFERLTGMRKSGVVGRRVTEVLPGIEPFWIETYGRVGLTGEAVTFERFYPAPLDRWYEVYAYRPAERQFAVIFKDITARKRAEEERRESEDRFKRAEEIAHLGSWELDLADNRLTWSDEVFRIFGLRPGEFGATYQSFLDAVHPDDRAAVDAAYSRSLAEGKDSYEIEHRVVRRDTGEVRIVREKCHHRRDASGRVVSSIGMVHDITETKRAEALRQALTEQERLRLGAAVEQASDCVAMLDLDGVIRYVNAAFTSVNRLAPDQAVGRSYFEFISGEPTAGALRETVNAGRMWRGQLTRPVTGGRPVELEIAISPVNDPSGAVIGWLVTEKDVTQENALQRQVRQAQKMEALGTLAGGITHDFNNILSTIFVNTELALLDLEPAHPARRSLPTVLQAANRGKELVKQIITFSRQKEWERKPLEVAPIVKEGLKFLRSTLPKDIAINEAIAADCGSVLADPSQIHQILVNLCQNASLAMADRAGQVDVRLEPVQVDSALAARHPDLKPGPHVRLTVADTGCGMTRELMERIFEPFFTTRKHGEGSGLGLSVVHGIVKSYDGAITVYSEPGKGSVFNVFLPQWTGEAGAGKKDMKMRPEKGREHILLVEDEPSQLQGIARVLERLGYRVTAKPSGRAALASFRRKPEAFDLVITDQTMPRLSGVELARALTKIRPGIPVILCTGFSEKVNGETVGRYGIRAFVMKPFTMQEISKHIRAALKK